MKEKYLSFVTMRNIILLGILLSVFSCKTVEYTKSSGGVYPNQFAPAPDSNMIFKTTQDNYGSGYEWDWDSLDINDISDFYNFYISDGTFTGNRIVDMDNYSLTFTNGNIINIGNSTYRNIGYGLGALNYNSVKNDNSAFGYNALTVNGTGAGPADSKYNSAFGSYALTANTKGAYNTAFGYNSMASLLESDYNSAFGARSLDELINGKRNMAIGQGSLGGLVNGSNCTALGNQAGDNLISGDYGIIIGSNVDFASTTSSYQLNIGDIITGDMTPTTGGTITFNGAYTFPNAAGTIGQIWELDASGNLVFVDPPSGSGTVTSVAAGDGMNFPTFTVSGSVKLATPGTTTATTTNAVFPLGHTHELDESGISITKSQVSDFPTVLDYNLGAGTFYTTDHLIINSNLYSAYNTYGLAVVGADFFLTGKGVFYNGNTTSSVFGSTYNVAATNSSGNIAWFDPDLELTGNLLQLSYDGTAINTGVDLSGIGTDAQDLNWVDGTNTMEISGGNNAIITGFLETEVDGLVTNEGSLTVGAGTTTTSIINSNTSGSTPVTLAEGSGIELTESGNTITITSTGGAESQDLHDVTTLDPNTTNSIKIGGLEIEAAIPKITFDDTGGFLDWELANGANGFGFYQLSSNITPFSIKDYQLDNRFEYDPVDAVLSLYNNTDPTPTKIFEFDAVNKDLKIQGDAGSSWETVYKDGSNVLGWGNAHPFARYYSNEVGTYWTIGTTQSVAPIDNESFDPDGFYSITANEITVSAIGYYEVTFTGEIYNDDGSDRYVDLEWKLGQTSISNTRVNVHDITTRFSNIITVTDIIYVDATSKEIGMYMTASLASNLFLYDNATILIKKL